MDIILVFSTWSIENMLRTAKFEARNSVRNPGVEYHNRLKEKDDVYDDDAIVTGNEKNDPSVDGKPIRQFWH